MAVAFFSTGRCGFAAPAATAYRSVGRGPRGGAAAAHLPASAEGALAHEVEGQLDDDREHHRQHDGAHEAVTFLDGEM